MALIWRALPADWPSYSDLNSHQWRLAPNGYWWLRWGGEWHQAASLSAGDVHGVRVPPDIVRENRNWLISGTQTPDEARQRAGCGYLMAQHERQIARAHMIMLPPGNSGGNPNTVIQPYRAETIPAPDIPPDFAEIQPGPGCCRECLLDDTPLYEGGLCRYCWMLAQLTAAIPAAPIDPAQVFRQAIFAQGRWAMITAVIVMLLAAYVALFPGR